MSLSSRRAWIEMRDILFIRNWVSSRSPHGERGLKLNKENLFRQLKVSLSSRRAWIEMMLSYFPSLSTDCRSPHGERGLKSVRRFSVGFKAGRSPHGERGLKLGLLDSSRYPPRSLSSRRAWIEIIMN